MAKTRRAQIDDRLLSEEIVLSSITDPAERIRKQYQIRKLQEEGNELDAVIAALRRPRGPR
jgi:hypothetical protein